MDATARCYGFFFTGCFIGRETSEPTRGISLFQNLFKLSQYKRVS